MSSTPFSTFAMRTLQYNVFPLALVQVSESTTHEPVNTEMTSSSSNTVDFPTTKCLQIRSFFTNQAFNLAVPSVIVSKYRVTDASSPSLRLMEKMPDGSFIDLAKMGVTRKS